MHIDPSRASEVLQAQMREKKAREAEMESKSVTPPQPPENVDKEPNKEEVESVTTTNVQDDSVEIDPNADVLPFDTFADEALREFADSVGVPQPVPFDRFDMIRRLKGKGHEGIKVEG